MYICWFMLQVSNILQCTDNENTLLTWIVFIHFYNSRLYVPKVKLCFCTSTPHPTNAQGSKSNFYASLCSVLNVMCGQPCCPAALTSRKGAPSIL